MSYDNQALVLGIIIGSGAFLVIAIVCAIVFIFIKRRHKKLRKYTTGNDQSLTDLSQNVQQNQPKNTSTPSQRQTSASNPASHTSTHGNLNSRQNSTTVLGSSQLEPASPKPDTTGSVRSTRTAGMNETPLPHVSSQFPAQSNTNSLLLDSVHSSQPLLGSRQASMALTCDTTDSAPSPGSSLGKESAAVVRAASSQLSPVNLQSLPNSLNPQTTSNVSPNAGQNLSVVNNAPNATSPTNAGGSTGPLVVTGAEESVGSSSIRGTGTPKGQQTQQQRQHMDGQLLGQNISGDLVYKPVHGHYQVLPDLLGQGSFGSVWKGRNEATGELVALKQVSDVAAAIQHELETLLSVDHPNIVRCYGMHQQENEKTQDIDVYLVMEFLAQGSLSHLQKAMGPLPYPLFIKVVKEILLAVDYLHGRGLIHRDIKPGNILMGIDGVAKLSDFGTARSFGTLTETATVAGTLLYMAPEAGAGVLTPASDIWSLGVTFLELLTGQLPWFNMISGGLNAMQIFFKVYHDQNAALTLPEEAPAPLCDLINLCLTRDHKARPSVNQLLHHSALTQQYPFAKLPRLNKDGTKMDTNKSGAAKSGGTPRASTGPSVESVTGTGFSSYNSCSMGDSTREFAKGMGWSFQSKTMSGRGISSRDKTLDSKDKEKESDPSSIKSDKERT